MVEYLLHHLSSGLLGEGMQWARFAVFEYTTVGREKRMTCCRYFETEEEAEVYIAEKEAAQ